MNEPLIAIQLEGDRQSYRPGDTLTGEYRLSAAAPDQVRALELSVLWYTEGTGDEDLAVCYFERLSAETGEVLDLRLPRRFSTAIPNTPLSYDGLIVKIHWCVRLRVFLRQGKELLAERPFQLGEIPPPQPLPEEENAS